MSKRARTRATSAIREVARQGLTGPFVFSYLLAVVVVYALVVRAGGWNILAFSRLLTLLNRAGIVPFTDGDTSIISRAPALEFQFEAREPIDWLMLVLAIGGFLLIFLVKSVQFHSFARSVGIDGPFGSHARAFLYGDNVNRFFPFGLGNVATASALQGQGAPLDRAALAVFMTEIFSIIEIAVFTLLAWRLLGVTGWMSAIVWPVIILFVAYLFRRTAVRNRAEGETTFRAAKSALSLLAQQPGRLAWLLLLSIAAFGLEVTAAYWIAQAFTSDFVLLNLEFQVVLVGILGGAIARRIPVSPGGIGQFEWGFSLSMYTVGAGFAAAGTVSIVVNLLRYVAGGIVFGALVFGKGVETNIGRVLELFKGETRATPSRREPARV
ncbi:MAG: lysylphosphatidylglycerol synthase transmembrane domain-containing protein [Actinomycetota bacterium]